MRQCSNNLLLAQQQIPEIVVGDRIAGAARSTER
jgi:hypothetical protein